MLEMAKETFHFYKYKTTKTDNQQQKQTIKSRDCIIRLGQKVNSKLRRLGQKEIRTKR